MKPKLTLGIEFSTQSVKIVVLDLTADSVIFTSKFDYDSSFPEYKTSGGILPSSIPQQRHTSPYMLIETIDKAFSHLNKNNIPLSQIRAIKCDAMQHCTVYTNNSFETIIKSLNPNKNLLYQLTPCISRPVSPIWEDRGTQKQADLLNKSAGTSGKITKLTGNKAELRFPAVQIMKWAEEYPEQYNNTSNIFLLSAFISSVLAGTIAPVDTGDGWGTNLNTININNPGWNGTAINYIDKYFKSIGIKQPLTDKLGNMAHYDAIIGKINKYFAAKYGINPNCIVLAGTGDNPATLLGCGGNIVISLGSSYTVNGIMTKIVPSLTGEYNVFGYTKGTAMALSCITNGGKVHNEFMEKYLRRTDWEHYIATAGANILEKSEKLMLPYLMDESVPVHKHGIIRENFTNNCPGHDIRALHISQILSLRLHSSHLGKVSRICVVAGGSKNRFLRQLISDMFNVETYTIKNSDYAAPLGCAISAAKTILKITYPESASRFVQEETDSVLYPIKENVPKIKILSSRYSKLEKSG